MRPGATTPARRARGAGPGRAPGAGRGVLASFCPSGSSWSRDLSRARHTLEETHARCEAQAPGLPIDQVLVRYGARLHEAYRAASELRAALIVMPRQRGVSGRDVAWLATMAGAPVLVARPATRGDAVVAATDMRDPGYPVLRRAAEWCQRLESTLVCVHNTGGAPASPGPAARSAIDLLQAALHFGRDAEGVVARPEVSLAGGERPTGPGWLVSGLARRVSGGRGRAAAARPPGSTP